MRKRNYITKKPQINHIVNVNIKIDYDKLEKAIVKANKINSEDSKSGNDKNQPKFWKSVGLIILNKKENNGHMTSSIISTVISALFNFFAFLFAVFFVVLPFYCIAYVYMNFIWSTDLIFGNIINIIMMIFFILFLGSLSIMFRAIANEIANEKDRNYIIAFSSGFVSFIALVISLVTIIKK